MDNITIRTATLEDAPQIQKIYEYYCKNTAISFAYEAPGEEEFRKKISDTLKKYPYLVAVAGDKMIGYAYAGPFIGREAYQWSVELTIYLVPEAKGHGLGRQLYEQLEEKLKSRGIRNLYACIGYPEEEDEYLTKNSAEFHEHMGFHRVGLFYKCGYKFERWYHMIWMEKIIGEHTKI